MLLYENLCRRRRSSVQVVVLQALFGDRPATGIRKIDSVWAKAIHGDLHRNWRTLQAPINRGAESEDQKRSTALFLDGSGIAKT